MSGDVTNLDPLGRVLLPASSRAASGIRPGDWVEFLVGPGRLVLRKLDRAPAETPADRNVIHDADSGQAEA